ncbi:50S ribosomal protein L40e [Candidatus Woesearchaeota archaeon]|nr:50S ribosomal protein L40e [Candidatus Woesearchaeota archaeon]HIH38073.1 50S ribosomal protein L40e [Candidatus Woesearchaeota archaeon]HIH48169.1 50S ribosomal protein L40e [Candidatus Woesearchaeota archaeon]HIJ04314.1 50S ribosomal protein L40e [Candidatus Woesearchaeota archaeon]
MAKFAEADNRLFKNRFACKRCKTVTKTSGLLVQQKKAACRKCGSKDLRPKRKK